MQNSENLNINEFVTEQLIKELKAGRIPWKRPWTPAGVPFNPVSKQPYTGINQLLLASLGYSTNYFLTFNQVKEVEAKVKGGEKGHTIVFWKKSETGDKKATMHPYTVFNIDQCEDLPIDMEYPELPEKPLQLCYDMIKAIENKPKIIFNGNAPEYFNASDTIVLPLFQSFSSKEEYYYALFQQLVISTGGEGRFNRKEVTETHPFGSRKYALRELTADLAAWQMVSIAGIPIPSLKYQEDYITKWIENLERDKYLAITAANYAQQSVNYLLNHSDSEVVPEMVPESTETDTQKEKKEKKSGRKKSDVAGPISSTE